MDIEQAKGQIADALRAYLARDALGNYRIPAVRQRPILLMGPPGIGKTQIMAQIAAEAGVGLVSYTMTHHTRQSAMGLPFLEERVYDGTAHTVTRYTMSEILASVHELMERTGIREGILFLDEINCVSETMAPMMLQFLQCKTFGNQPLPEGWLIVAAGNPPEYNRSVRDFDVVTLDRVRRIDVEPDFGVWKSYALRKGIHGAVVSYLEIRGEHFYKVEESADGPRAATARGWEDLSELIGVYEDLGLRVDQDVIGQYIQVPEIARGLAGYLDLYYKYQRAYGVGSVLEGRWEAVTAITLREAPFDERVAVLGLLISRLGAMAREVWRQDALTEALHEALTEVRDRIADEGAGALLDRIVRERRGRLTAERESGRLDTERRDLLQRTAATLETYRGRLREAGTDADPEAAMGSLRDWYAGEVDRRERLGTETGAAFGHAFRFLEEAVGQGQELALFVTEIAASYHASWFVEEFGCEAYDRHSRELFFEDRRSRIRDRILSAKGAGTDG